MGLLAGNCAAWFPGYCARITAQNALKLTKNTIETFTVTIFDNFRLFLSLFDGFSPSLWQQFVLRVAIFVSLLKVYIKKNCLRSTVHHEIKTQIEKRKETWFRLANVFCALNTYTLALFCYTLFARAFELVGDSCDVIDFTIASGTRSREWWMKHAAANWPTNGMPWGLRAPSGDSHVGGVQTENEKLI